VPVPAWITGVFVVVFLLFCAHFLYFFVDDEGITFVYARNLLRGDGLVYNHIEARAEGYSNFLHVLLAAVILAAVRLADWPQEAAFYLAKAFSVISGVALVGLLGFTLSRRPEQTRLSVAAALTTLALAGPVGLWSASSLETVPFAFVLLLFATRIWNDGEQFDWLALASGAAVLLWRIDGFVYIAAVLGPALLLASGERRLRLFARYAAPLVAIFAVYTALRWLYFGAVLTEPLATKVLYKFRVHGYLVTKLPERGYLQRFLDQYGWMAPSIVLAVAMVISGRDRWTLRLIVTTLLLTVYVGVVGDWMYGFRFLVVVIAFYAMLIGLVLAAVSRARPRAGAAAAVALAVWASIAGVSFARRYMVDQASPSWLARPSGDPQLYFWRYWDLLEYARPLAPPGTVIAYNQAGFIPFMLDAENIDDVGLCSRFVARLPTTDVFFTEAGRYSPLTPAPVLRASEAYILYREPAVIIAPADALRSANNGLEPMQILGGRYTLDYVDSSRSNVIYLPTGGRPEPFRERSGFLENVAHTSRLRSTRVDGVIMPASRYGAEMAFLAGLGGWTSIGNLRHYAIRFDEADVPIHEIYIGDIRSDQTAQAALTLFDSGGRRVWEVRLDISPARQRKHWRLAAPVSASQLAMTLTAPSEAASVRMTDVRVQGQPPALKAYIDAMLPDLAPSVHQQSLDASPRGVR
jgi:arabinofuranosyltransferase